NLLVFRPGDAVETAEAWQCALAAEESPSILALSRQGLEQFRLGDLSENMTARGAYIAVGEADERQVTLMASGSEVGIAISAHEMLAADSIAATVVSVPCMELFRQQDAAWQKMVLGTAPRIAIEAAIRQPWDWILGENDTFVGMDDFGASAPAGELFPHFGITADAVVAAAKTRVA
ncbi:MAG: transketolase C-terminal domain-containing protein, partial [Pseudomonadota bacterium]|nr:transketolase C-terminal domain-containing protein [Pseudomonadota bacterium]